MYYLFKVLRFNPSPRHLARLLCRSRTTMGFAEFDSRPAEAPHVDGFVMPQFAPLYDIFRENFSKRWESAGAAFAVYYHGELVVDLYGGYADPLKNTLWQNDTLTVLFSCTKSLSALTLAMLIDQGRASYDDLVCRYWPEFGANGKEKITIKQLAQHEAGLAYGRKVVNVEDVADPKRMSRLFEEMTPLWEPGSRCGYHALTYGFLLDQLVRRIDAHYRAIVDVFEQDILTKFGVNEVSIGLVNEAQNERVARVVEQSDAELLEEGRRNPEGFRRFTLSNNEHMQRLYENWPWIKICDYNKLENRVLRMPSNMGIGSARGLARVHSLVAEGRLLSPTFLECISRPQLIDQLDVINGYPENKGFGWQYTTNKTGGWNFGHSGYGGQNVRVDLQRGLAYAYVCNGLKAADADAVDTFAALQDALYECVDRAV